MVKLLFAHWRMAIRLCSLRFTDSAVNDVLRARKHAAERHQREVAPEHVLLALATDPRGFARTALVRLGLDLDLDLDLSGQAKAIARLLDAAPTEPLSDNPTLGQATEHVLRQAREQALASGQKYVGTEHLLLGLLSVPSPGASYLHGHGITKKRYVRFLHAWYADS
jgi:ATP-dependent Clp protease ATP-binding subunit ClpA